ncbi:unnamed protein product [Pleuronectes platessa]|uniref:Uncharacterized protein n=1 Tax=Pleuronectes platessa TaxID=8262 RepID=A0A9N7ULF8_PLEPL|nr:unnamed protein product [Pleuronectes platessa]
MSEGGRPATSSLFLHDTIIGSELRRPILAPALMREATESSLLLSSSRLGVAREEDGGRQGEKLNVASRQKRGETPNIEIPNASDALEGSAANATGTGVKDARSHCDKCPITGMSREEAVSRVGLNASPCMHIETSVRNTETTVAPTLPSPRSEVFKPCVEDKDLAFCLNEGECSIIETVAGVHRHCRHYPEVTAVNPIGSTGTFPGGLRVTLVKQSSQSSHDIRGSTVTSPVHDGR